MREEGSSEGAAPLEPEEPEEPPTPWERRLAWVSKLPGAQFHDEQELQMLARQNRGARRAAGANMRRALRQAERAVRRQQKKGTP